MRKEISKLKWQVNLFIVFIFFGAVFLVCFFVANVYKQRMETSWTKNFDNLSNEISEQFRLNPKFDLKVLNQDATIFAVNALDGSLVRAHVNASKEASEVWEMYRSKLIYQMQKQQRGVLSYPDREPSAFLQGQWVIRFYNIDEMGLILAVESYRPSFWKELIDIWTPVFIIKFLIIFVVMVVSCVFLIDRFSRRVRNIVTTSLETSLMNFNEHDVTASPKTKEKLKLHQEQEDDEQEEKHSVLSNRPIVSTTTSSVLAESKKETVNKDIVKDNIQSKIESKSGQDKAKYSQLNAKTKIDFNKVVEKSLSNQNESLLTKKDPKLDELTVDIQGVESPVLKKMLKELRNK